MTKQAETTEVKPEVAVVKKRKTIDDILGINGLLIIAIVGNSIFKGGLFSPIASVCGLSAIYYLIKRRKTLDKKQKQIGWGLVILWLVIFSIFDQIIKG